MNGRFCYGLALLAALTLTVSACDTASSPEEPPADGPPMFSTVDVTTSSVDGTDASAKATAKTFTARHSPCTGRGADAVSFRRN